MHFSFDLVHFEVVSVELNEPHFHQTNHPRTLCLQLLPLVWRIDLLPLFCRLSLILAIEGRRAISQLFGGGGGSNAISPSLHRRSFPLLSYRKCRDRDRQIEGVAAASCYFLGPMPSRRRVVVTNARKDIWGLGAYKEIRNRAWSLERFLVDRAPVNKTYTILSVLQDSVDQFMDYDMRHFGWCDWCGKSSKLQLLAQELAMTSRVLVLQWG